MTPRGYTRRRPATAALPVTAGGKIDLQNGYVEVELIATNLLSAHARFYLAAHGNLEPLDPPRLSKDAHLGDFL